MDYSYLKKYILNNTQENQAINEVRLPMGYFKVINGFMLPGKDNFDIIFNKDKFIQINTETKQILMWSVELNKWTPCSISYNELMGQTLYAKFKENTIRIGAEKLPRGVDVDSVAFNTTVRAFNKRAQEEGLTLDDKIKVVLL